MSLFWYLTTCRLVGPDTNVSEKHTVFIFRAEMAMLEVTGFIYIRSDEGVASMNGPITVEE
jgi:hypothetical protein